MPDFYDLSEADQARCMGELAVAALERWGGNFRDVELVKYRENAVFSVFDETGRRFALRIHRHGYHSDEELLSEIQWMNALRADGLAVPEIIPAKDGAPFVIVSAPSIPEARQVDLLGWLDGSPVGATEDLPSSDNGELAGLYRAAGALAARVHNQSSAWSMPTSFTRHAWDEEGLLGENPFWGPFWELAKLDDADRLLIGKARAKASVELASIGKASQSYGLIHADFVPENLLKRGDQLMLIDFDDAGFGWHMFELATALYFHLDAPYYPSIRDALIAGYRSQRPLADEEWERLPLFLLLRSLTYLGWVHTRHETQTARELTPMLIERTRGLAKDYLQLR